MRLLFAAAVALTVTLFCAQAAIACSCVDMQPKEMLPEAEGAVVARLLAVKPTDPDRDPNTLSSADPTDFIFRTGVVVKGRRQLRRGRRLVVRSVRDEASCGLSGDPGDLLGLFLERGEGRWRSGGCLQVTAADMRRLARSRQRSAAVVPSCA
jgi:hypothetical protein